MSTRTGTVRTASSMISSGRIKRSDDAGGAAIAEGASARGGAGMNDAGRGFSVESQAAAGAPLDVTRKRGRRARFSGFGAAGTFGATGPLGGAGGTAAGFTSSLAAALTVGLAGGFAAGF